MDLEHESRLGNAAENTEEILHDDKGAYKGNQTRGKGIEDGYGSGDLEGISSGDDEEMSLINRHINQSHNEELVDAERDNTANQSLMNFIKANIGTGILALPAAFKHGGLWVSFVGIAVMAVIALHCIHLLLKCNVIVCRRTGRSQMDYGDVVEMAFHSGSPSLRKFAPASKIVMNLFLVITQLGFCTVYIHFVAENVHQVIDENLRLVDWDARLFDLFVFLLLIPYVCIKNLRTLALFSMCANVFMFVGLFITLQYCFYDLPSVNDRPAFGGWKSLPLFFGIAIYAFEGIGVVLPIENKMRHPEDLRGWTGVVNTGLVIVASLYTAVGFFGYLQFGDEVAGSITLNLPAQPWYMAVKLIFAGAIFFSYGLQFYVPIDILWPIIGSKAQLSYPRQYERWINKYGEYVLRMILLTLTFVLAVAIPKLDLMIALIGALSSSAVALIIPPLLEMVTLHPEGTLRWWQVVKDVAIMIFGFIGFVVGTVTTCIAIAQAFHEIQ